jgi:diguanylate cyclase (GGDEF)-like protein/PAS domain S-box-containing protein
MQADRRASDFAPKTDPEFYRQLLDHIADGIYFVDRERRIHYWNKGAEQITGFSAAEILGRQCHDAVLNHVDAAGRSLCRGDGCPLILCMFDCREHQDHIFLHNKDGRRVPVKVRSQPMYNDLGQMVGAVEIFSDATAEFEMRRRTEAMQRMAFIDHLTELPNRRYLEMTLRSLLTEARPPQENFGILLFDLDRLKFLNDTCGHSAGDEALRQAGHAVASALRPTDIAGRWGGDEFLAIVHNVDAEILSELARRAVTMTGRKQVTAQAQQIQLSISAGATLVRPGETLEQLVVRADALLYRSKSGGGGRATMD